MIIYTDHVISEIGRHIASFHPERGGALLGIPFTNVVCRFVPDPGAITSRSTYIPSPDLQRVVQEQEVQHGLQFFGIAHSHPGSYSEPSGQDHLAFRNALDVNPHLATFIAPIITLDRDAEEENGTELTLKPFGRLTSYAAYRSKRIPVPRRLYGSAGSDSDLSQNSITLAPASCSLMPLDGHVSVIISNLENLSLAVKRASGFISLGGALFQSETLKTAEIELILLFPPTYPFSKPIVLLTSQKPGQEKTIELEFYWPALVSNSNVLWDLIERQLGSQIEQ